jgi:hypothetical protein
LAVRFSNRREWNSSGTNSSQRFRLA